MKNKKLHNIKSAGFNTPNDYFESFDEKVFSKLNTENQLNSIKETGFKVPDNYFESFNINILDENLNKKDVKVIQLFNKRNLIYISSIAAAILILFNLSVFDNNPSFDNLNIETVENYIIDEDISSYEIATLFSDKQIEESIIFEHNLNDDNLEEYLLNNVDLEDLMVE